MKSFMVIFLVLQICVLITHQAIISPNILTINMVPSKYLTIIYNSDEVDSSYDLQHLMCAVGAQVGNYDYSNETYTKREIKLMVDPRVMKADCVGVIKYPYSDRYVQHWFLFSPGITTIAKYNVDNSKWALTPQEISEKYALTGRLTQTYTNNTAPIDKIMYDQTGKKYRVQQKFRSQLVKTRTSYLQNYFLEITITTLFAI